MSHSCNNELLRKVTLLSGEIVREMDTWGVRWLKHGRDYQRVGSVDVGRGPANLMMEGGGPAMMMAVRAEVIRRGIDVVNRVLVNDLLTIEGAAAGAVGMDTRTGRIHVFRAKTVVMATGPMMVPFHRRDGAGRGRGMPIDLAGDGHAAMLRAGVTFGKLELGSAAVVPWHMFAAPGLEMLLALGGKGIFVNAEGQQFMVATDVNRDMRVRSAVGVSILREMREGRGPVYLDITGFSPDQFRLLNSVIPIVMRNFEAVGFDPAVGRTPYSVIVTATHSVGGGGAAVDDRMATSMPRLYAAGNCTDGAYMSMQQNLTDCASMGYFAGINAGDEVKSAHALVPAPEQIEALVSALKAPLERKGGLSYPELRERIHSLYSETMGMVFNQSRCEKILSELATFLENDLPRASAEEARDVCRIHSLGNFAQTLCAVVTAVSHRTESRGNVLREDFPLIDNKNWLCYTRLKRDAGGEFALWDEPLKNADAVPPTATLHPYFA